MWTGVKFTASLAITVIQTIGSFIRTELQQSSSKTKAAKVIIGHQEIKTSTFSPPNVIPTLFLKKPAQFRRIHKSTEFF